MTVVVGTDGSAGAERGVDAAARLAVAQGVPLVVVSGHRDQEFRQVGPEGDEFFVEPGDDAIRVSGESARRVRAAVAGLDVVARAEQGKPAEAILAVAEELGADLIVVGNRRVQGVSRVLGSIATEVARKAPCDVYIAHTQD